MKDITFKKLVSNLFLFVFIIAFISVYSFLFGSANMLMGVMILTALLMFQHMDIGIHYKQAPALITSMFVLIGISSSLSLVNPLMGIFINLTAIFILILLFSEKLEYQAYLPFILCYIFAQGNPPTPDEFTPRMIGLFVGAILVSTLYYLKHRKPDTEETLPTVQVMLRTLDLTSVRFQYAVKMALGISLAMLIGSVFHLERAMWIGVSAFSLIQPEYKQTKERIKHRLTGTLLGATAFIFISVTIPSQYVPVVILLLGYVYMFVTEYRIKMIFITINALSAALILFDYNVAVPLRLWFVFIGAAIAVVISNINYASVLSKIKSIFAN